MRWIGMGVLGVMAVSSAWTLTGCSLALSPEEIEFETTANVVAEVADGCVGAFFSEEDTAGPDRRCLRTCQSAWIDVLGGTGSIQKLRWEFGVKSFSPDPPDDPPLPAGASQQYGPITLNPGASSERSLAVELRVDRCLNLADLVGVRKDQDSIIKELVGSGDIQIDGLGDGVFAVMDAEVEIRLAVNDELTSPPQVRAVRTIVYENEAACAQLAPSCYTQDGISTD